MKSESFSCWFLSLSPDTSLFHTKCLIFQYFLTYLYTAKVFCNYMSFIVGISNLLNVKLEEGSTGTCMGTILQHISGCRDLSVVVVSWRRFQLSWDFMMCGCFRSPFHTHILSAWLSCTQSAPESFFDYTVVWVIWLLGSFLIEGQMCYTLYLSILYKLQLFLVFHIPSLLYSPFFCHTSR